MIWCTVSPPINHVLIVKMESARWDTVIQKRGASEIQTL